MNPGAACGNLVAQLEAVLVSNRRGHAEHEGSGNSRFASSNVMPCASPSGLFTGETREHVGKRYLSFFPSFVFFVSSDGQAARMRRAAARVSSRPGMADSGAAARDGRRRRCLSAVLSWSFPAPGRRLCAAKVPNQTMKALLPIFVRFAFFLFFASFVVESLRS